MKRGYENFFLRTFQKPSQYTLALYQINLINNENYVDENNFKTIPGVNPKDWPYDIEYTYVQRAFDDISRFNYAFTNEVISGGSVINKDYIKFQFNSPQTVRGFYMFGGMSSDVNGADLAKPNTVVIFDNPIYTDQLWVLYAISLPIQ